jgi:hypothetical protein
MQMAASSLWGSTAEVVDEFLLGLKLRDGRGGLLLGVAGTPASPACSQSAVRRATLHHRVFGCCEPLTSTTITDGPLAPSTHA